MSLLFQKEKTEADLKMSIDHAENVVDLVEVMVPYIEDYTVAEIIKYYAYFDKFYVQPNTPQLKATMAHMRFVRAISLLENKVKSLILSSKGYFNKLGGAKVGPLKHIEGFLDNFHHIAVKWYR